MAELEPTVFETTSGKGAYLPNQSRKLVLCYRPKPINQASANDSLLEKGERANDDILVRLWTRVTIDHSREKLSLTQSKLPQRWKGCRTSRYRNFTKASSGIEKVYKKERIIFFR
jgi:hypothetical protein